MSIYQSVEAYMQEKQLLAPKVSVLVAVSGGADSVALAHVLKHLGYRVHIGHVNFQTRGEDSNKDEMFVQKLADDLEVPFFYTRISLKNSNSDSSIQLQARHARYQWLEEMRRQHSLSAIATAHHANDQLETVLYRFLHRSVGIAGIAGIPHRRQHIIRPFLSLQRQEIVQFLDQEKLSWQEDKTNTDTQYDRNWIRNQLIPLLEVRFPQWKQNALRQLSINQESQVIYQQFFERYVHKKIASQDGEYRFPILWIQKSGYAKSILWHYLEPCGFNAAQLEDVMRLFESKNGKWVASASHQIYKHQKFLFLAPLTSPKGRTSKLIKECESTTTPDGVLSIQKIVADENDAKKKNNPLCVYVAAKNIQFPLRLRPWKAGDYYYPLGMKNKKKKIARLLIDKKYPKNQKEKIWVVESEKKIIWVTGLHIDERFKLQQQASPAYQLEWQPLQAN